mgnify:CR=1 FL=1
MLSETDGGRCEAGKKGCEAVLLGADNLGLCRMRQHKTQIIHPKNPPPSLHTCLVRVAQGPQDMRSR